MAGTIHNGQEPYFTFERYAVGGSVICVLCMSSKSNPISYMFLLHLFFFGFDSADGNFVT